MNKYFYIISHQIGNGVSTQTTSEETLVYEAMQVFGYPVIHIYKRHGDKIGDYVGRIEYWHGVWEFCDFRNHTRQTYSNEQMKDILLRKKYEVEEDV